MLSSFKGEGTKQGWGELAQNMPKDVYALGRLDADSEGLLLLTNDKSVNERLLHPRHKHQRTYLVQVEGEPDEKALSILAAGPEITVEGKRYRTAPCKVRMLPEPQNLPLRDPPVRFRKSIPTSWLELQLTEGKNRQVRKMTAAVGFPTLRLIRSTIGEIRLGTMQPGDFLEMPSREFYKKLGLGR